MIKAGMMIEGRGTYQYHALKGSGNAACSSYLYVRATGDAHKIKLSNRCRSRACQKLFAEADRIAVQECDR